jgi:DNA-directed RNA polymerase subunit M/transcription elongation factor TFIIS
MQNESKIKCPNCGIEIDVQNVLTHQLEEDIKKNYNARLAIEKKKYDDQVKLLAAEKATFEEKKKKENELFQERLETKLKDIDLCQLEVLER